MFIELLIMSCSAIKIFVLTMVTKQGGEKFGTRFGYHGNWFYKFACYGNQENYLSAVKFHQLFDWNVHRKKECD